MNRKKMLAVVLTAALTVSMSGMSVPAEDLLSGETGASEEVQQTEGEDTEASYEEQEAPSQEIQQEEIPQTQEEPSGEDAGGEDLLGSGDDTEQGTEETQAPAEKTQTEPQEGELPASETEEQEPSPTPTEEPEEQTTSVVTNEEELRAAIERAPYSTDATVIIIAGDLSLSDTVSIPENKTICLITTSTSCEISRAEGFKGDMFQVSGRLSFREAELLSSDTASGKITVDGTLLDDYAEGSIIHVDKKDALFVMDDSTTLTGNRTKGKGGAIHALGTVFLLGGTIRDNEASEGGAVYTENMICAEGKAVVTENRDNDGASSNIALEGTEAVLMISKKLTEGKLKVHSTKPEDDLCLVMVSQDADTTVEEALQSVSLDDDSSFILEKDGFLTEITEDPELSRISGPDWTSDTTAEMTCESNVDGWYYAAWAESDAPVPDLSNEEGIEVTAGEDFTITYDNIETENPVTVYVLLKDTHGNLSAKRSAPLAMAENPNAGQDGQEQGSGSEGTEGMGSDTGDGQEQGSGSEGTEGQGSDTGDGQEQGSGSEGTEGMGSDTGDNPEQGSGNEGGEGGQEDPAPQRDPIIAVVEDSTTEGLDETYALKPDKYYDFSVIGAGMENKEPIEGDTRWIPDSWEWDFDVEGGVKHEEWKFGLAEGLNEETTLLMIVNFHEEVYNASGEWEPTDKTGQTTYDVKTMTYHEPVIADIEDSVIEGLEKALELKPNTYYDFSVTGAGEDNEEPGDGDTKWVPAYWTWESSSTKNMDWKIGIKAGKNEDGAIPIRVYFTEQKYNEETEKWEDTGTEEYLPAEVKTKKYSTVTVTDTPTPVPTHTPILADVKDSTVQGLENPLELKPETYYEFSATGAGTDNVNPGEGDTRWIPIYWMMEGGTTKQYNWQIGAKGGVNDTRSIPIRVFFKQQRYNATSGTWQDTAESEDYITVNVQTKTYEEVTPTPTHDPVIANINDTVIRGLEEPLMLTPKTFYKFSVIGAGTNNMNPGEGDIRWTPVYWMMEGGTTKQYNWQVGAANGISDARTIPIRVYLQQQKYNGSTQSWEATGVENYITANVQTQSYDPATLTVTIDPTDPSNPSYSGGGAYYSGDGTYTGGTSDPATSPNGDGTTTGSGTAAGARTGDNTQTTTLLLLAVLSLITGGYAAVRKRVRG